jgi:hypothetical protein
MALVVTRGRKKGWRKHATRVDVDDPEGTGQDLPNLLGSGRLAGGLAAKKGLVVKKCKNKVINGKKWCKGCCRMEDLADFPEGFFPFVM